MRVGASPTLPAPLAPVGTVYRFARPPGVASRLSV
jgi:hypothetical protein